MPLTSSSPEAIFRLVFREACILSSFPIVCWCLVVAHLIVMPKMRVISATNIEVNAEPLSVMRVLGKYECFVIISIITFAVLAAVASTNG